MSLRDFLEYTVESLGYFFLGGLTVFVSVFSLLNEASSSRLLVIAVSWLGLIAGLLMILYSLLLDFEEVLESISNALDEDE